MNLQRTPNPQTLPKPLIAHQKNRLIAYNSPTQTQKPGPRRSISWTRLMQPWTSAMSRSLPTTSRCGAVWFGGCRMVSGLFVVFDVLFLNEWFWLPLMFMFALTKETFLGICLFSFSASNTNPSNSRWGGLFCCAVGLRFFCITC